ncbi:MAG: TetR/AcrR family transcriptional regulator [Xanthomonadales bacterium]|nr:TetR/AcrR family transcriptional regulator [Xanthomonadales bacterium]MBK7145389.1 TetR/AcrR family transcriptional regulator [Xanthomonadales bacterium]MCC6561357.1 TetR/AcrR family transcriptional regulator [Xanthomonadales bacterium]
MPSTRTAELRGERARLSSADWEAAALDLLAEQGVAAVAVEPLARRLGVTKGSFYWHFPSREALLKAALERWERLDETTVFAPLEEIADARARLRELFVSTSREMRTHRLYSELLKALDHPVVQPVMARVSQRRIHFLMQAYRALNFSRRDAMDRARLVYSAYVGYLQLMLQLKLTRMSAEEFDAYVLHVVATFIPRE